MQVKFRLLFWVYKSRMNEQQESPIMLRVTINQERWNKATGIWISPKKWLAPKERVKGDGEEATLINPAKPKRNKILQIWLRFLILIGLRRKPKEIW